MEKERQEILNIENDLGTLAEALFFAADIPSEGAQDRIDLDIDAALA
jgi:hypothetical protein